MSDSLDNREKNINSEDGEIPTAASNLENPELTIEYDWKDSSTEEPGRLHKDIKSMIVPEEHREETVIKAVKINREELVRRSDHEQKLEEAKSKYTEIAKDNLGNGAKAERQRITEQIKEKLQSYLNGDKAVDGALMDKSELLQEFSEELLDEVEHPED